MNLEMYSLGLSEKIHPHIARLSLACLLVDEFEGLVATREPIQNGLAENVRSRVEPDSFVFLAEFFHQSLPGLLRHILNIGEGLLQDLLALLNVRHPLTPLLSIMAVDSARIGYIRIRDCRVFGSSSERKKAGTLSVPLPIRY